MVSNETRPLVTLTMVVCTQRSPLTASDSLTCNDRGVITYGTCAFLSWHKRRLMTDEQVEKPHSLHQSEVDERAFCNDDDDDDEKEGEEEGEGRGGGEEKEFVRDIS